MKNIYKIGSFFLLSFVLFTYACEHEQGVGPPGGGLEPTFSSIQTNIFTLKCVNAGCHPGGGAPPSLPLQAGVAYNALVNVPSVFAIPRVDPANANNSALYLKVIGDNSVGSRMPLSRNALSSAETNAIRDWINNGAQNN
ncbi:hypothetical protein IIA28_14345 [candidate division KSB1 bacterium]|nr:hypothetical protein [candidate division KSB1 bacterium]